MLQVVPRKELSSCPSRLSISAHLHIRFKCVIQHRATQAESVRLGVHDRTGSLGLTDDFTHLPN